MTFLSQTADTDSATLPGETPEGTPVPSFMPWRATRERRDGWSPATQMAFIFELTRIGIVGLAARAVGKSARSAYALRQKPGAESFAAAWDAAVSRAGSAAYAVAVSRALHGELIPQYRAGRFTGFKVRQNDRLLIAAIKAQDASAGELETRRRSLERWEMQLRRMQIGIEQDTHDGRALTDAEEDHRVWAREIEREKRRQRNAEIRAAVRKGLAPHRPPDPRVRVL